MEWTGVGETSGQMRGAEKQTWESVSGSFEVSLSQKLHPLISLGRGLGVLPVVICDSLKCRLED